MFKIGLQFFASKGLKYPCYAKATESAGAITYGSGALLGAAQTINVSWERSGEMVSGNDAVILTDKTITGGTVTLGLTDLTDDIEVNVLGATEGAEIDAITGAKELSENELSEPTIVGFGIYGESKDDSNRVRYRAMWIKKVQFVKATDEAETKKVGATFKTPTIVGQIMKAADGNWREKATFSTEAAAIAWLNGKSGISAAVSVGLSELSGSNLTLSPAFSAAIFNYSGVATGNVAITAEAAGTIKLFVDGVYNQTLVTTVAGTAVPMAAGNNKLFTIVIQESGKAPITTKIMVQRAA